MLDKHRWHPLPDGRDRLQNRAAAIVHVEGQRIPLGSPHPFEAVEGRVKPALGTVDAEYLGTFRHKPAGHRQTDAACNPRDERNLALESSLAHRLLPLRYLWHS
jgi:hypothetical protein